MSKTVGKIIQVARGEFDNRFKLSIYDGSDRVQEYFSSVGHKDSGKDDWCAAFVYWCINTACKDTDTGNPFPVTANCPTIFEWADGKGFIRKITEKPEPGDVFLRCDFSHQGYQAAGHTGFVSKVDGTNIITLEGNTSDDTSEKDTVCERVRPTGGKSGKYIFRFVNTQKALGETHAEPEDLNPVKLMHQVYMDLDLSVSDEFARGRVKAALNRFNGHADIRKFYEKYRV